MKEGGAETKAWMGPSFKEKELGEPHKVLEGNHEAVSRCFRDHQEEVRPRVGCT